MAWNVNEVKNISDIKLLSEVENDWGTQTSVSVSCLSSADVIHCLQEPLAEEGIYKNLSSLKTPARCKPG